MSMILKNLEQEAAQAVSAIYGQPITEAHELALFASVSTAISLKRIADALEADRAPAPVARSLTPEEAAEVQALHRRLRAGEPLSEIVSGAEDLGSASDHYRRFAKAGVPGYSRDEKS